MSFQWLAGLRRTPSLPTEGVVGLEKCAVYSAEAESNRKIKRERKEGQRRSGFRVWFQHDLGGTAGPGGATASIRKAKASCFPRTSLRIGLGCFLLFILTQIDLIPEEAEWFWGGALANLDDNLFHHLNLFKKKYNVPKTNVNT